MKSFFIKMFVFLLVSASFGCDPAKKAAGSSTCQTVGTVKDFTGLDGCKILILLDDGTKLLPSKIADKNFKLIDGQRIAFDYREDKEFGMTICMAEDMIVEITCIKSLDEKPSGKNECTDTTKPIEVEWMKKLIDTHHPIRISKYQYGDSYIYFFQGKPDSYAYDCRGKLVCDMVGNEKNDCFEQIQTFAKGRVIYLGESSNH